MTHPILQLKVSRLRHNKREPDKGDYFQAMCYQTKNLVIFQARGRFDGMLSAVALGTASHVRFNPVTLEGKMPTTGTVWVIHSAEVPPPALLEYIFDFPIGGDRRPILNEWFKFTEPYINSINEFL